MKSRLHSQNTVYLYNQVDSKNMKLFKYYLPLFLIFLSSCESENNNIYEDTDRFNGHIWENENGSNLIFNEQYICINNRTFSIKKINGDTLFLHGENLISHGKLFRKIKGNELQLSVIEQEGFVLEFQSNELRKILQLSNDKDGIYKKTEQVGNCKIPNCLLYRELPNQFLDDRIYGLWECTISSEGKNGEKETYNMHQGKWLIEKEGQYFHNGEVKTKSNLITHNLGIGNQRSLPRYHQYISFVFLNKNVIITNSSQFQCSAIRYKIAFNSPSSMRFKSINLFDESEMIYDFKKIATHYEIDLSDPFDLKEIGK